MQGRWFYSSYVILWSCQCGKFHNDKPSFQPARGCGQPAQWIPKHWTWVCEDLSWLQYELLCCHFIVMTWVIFTASLQIANSPFMLQSLKTDWVQTPSRKREGNCWPSSQRMQAVSFILCILTYDDLATRVLESHTLQATFWDFGWFWPCFNLLASFQCDNCLCNSSWPDV